MSPDLINYIQDQNDRTQTMTKETNRNRKFQTTLGSTYTSDCAIEKSEKTFSNFSFAKKSPSIELYSNEDVGNTLVRFGDNSTVGQKTVSESPFIFSQRQELDVSFDFNAQRDGPNQNKLLKKWNRKFSQMAGQLKDDKEKLRAGMSAKGFDSEIDWFESIQTNSESLCVDNRLSEPGTSCSYSESFTPSSPHADINNENQSVKILPSTEDPFTAFSLIDSDFVEDSNTIWEKQMSCETLNVSPNSKTDKDNFEIDCADNENVHEVQQPEESLKVDAREDYINSDTNAKESFSLKHLQKAESSIKRCGNGRKRSTKAFCSTLHIDVIQEKSDDVNLGNHCKESMSPDTEDPLRGCNSKADSLKSVNDGRKRNNGSAMERMMKRFKSDFKPPTRQGSNPQKMDLMKNHKGKMSDGGHASKEARAGSSPFVDFFSLAPKKQNESITEINFTKHASFTLVMSNGRSLVNHFEAGLDCTQDPSIMLLTGENNCFQLTINSDTKEQIKEILFHNLSNLECETIIPNSKEFLSALYKILNLDADHIVSYEGLEDPVLASWLLNPDKPPTSFSMMCQTAHLKFTGVENDWLSCLSFAKKLMNSLKRCLERDCLMKLYKNIEIRLVSLLASLENQCLRVDIDIFRKFADVLKNKLHKLEESAHKQVGHKFTINSHPQLRQILYEELKLDSKLPPTSKIGKTCVSHLKSTCESSLLLLTDFHPLPSIVLEFRTLQKLKSTYIDGMLSCMVNSSISTHWDQTSAATGRLTSYQPNIQNIPKTVVVVEDYLPNTILGSAPKSRAEIYAREPFICHDGFVFLAADFQQIELRILAHLSDDKALLSMFWKPDSIDIFSLLTAEWKNTDVSTVSNEERETTKRVVYSVMYGVGKEKLADYLKVKPDIAKEIIQNFLARFPAIDFFTKKCCSYAKEYGYTETICGRRRYFPYINSKSPALRAQAQRQAVNFCVQGSAADICKLAMLEVESSLKKQPELNYKLLLQIHDELLWEVAEEDILQVKGIIENVMENAKTLCHKFCSLQVPLTVSFSTGKSWAHLSPFTA